MGCWNKTCAVSNLHITAGQRVVIFMLGKQPKQYDFCYVNSYYDLCLLPFYGEYNDYGAAENCSGIGMNYIVEELRNKLVEMEQGKNPYHDPPAKKETFDIEQLFELDHEGRLSVEGKNWPIGEARTVTHVQIHGDVFDHIIEHHTFEDSYFDKTGGKEEFKTRTYNFKDVVADIPEYIGRLRSETESLRKLDGPESAFRKLMSRQLTSMLFKYEERNLAGKWLTFGSVGSMDRPFLINGAELVITEASKMNDEQLTELLTEFLKGAWINAFMTATRKAWVKPIGEGSQNNEHKGFDVLIGAMQVVLSKEKGEIEEARLEEEKFMREYEAKEAAKKTTKAKKTKVKK